MKYLLVVLSLLLADHSLLAQQVYLDQPVQAGDLILFPQVSDSSKYYYLLNNLALTNNPQNGGAQFSLLSWNKNEKLAVDSASEAGAVIYALIELKITEAQLANATIDLKSKLNRAEAAIVGPLSFGAGQMTILVPFKDENGVETPKKLGIGNRPIFVDNKAAIAIKLDQLSAKFLREALNAPLPALRFAFQMDVNGYSHAAPAQTTSTETSESKKLADKVDLGAKPILDVRSFLIVHDLAADLKSCNRCWEQPKNFDARYPMREILFSLDGFNADDFGKYFSSATVALRKKHGNGKVSTNEIRVDAQKIAESENTFKLQYGWQDISDANPLDFLRYEYKIAWETKDGATIQGDWKQADQLFVLMEQPFSLLPVNAEAELKLMKDNGIEDVRVKLFYDYGNGEKVQAMTIKATDATGFQEANLLLKKDSNEFEYEIVWQTKNGKSYTSGRKKTKFPFLLVDEIPKDALELK